MDYVIVFLLGVAVALVPAALWAAAQHRPAAAPVAPAQPPAPIIVMPPAPQPVTNNYTYNDNRQMTIATTPDGGLPLIADRQREIQVAQQRERVFKVVGKREEW